MADSEQADNGGHEQPYQALYRRYRPQRFSDVRGQEHVTRALRNAVRDDRVAHAYLFSGPRGTGKTSTARILAMALNCESPQDGEPDGTCTSCVSVRNGSSMDVFELDAASNRKLDEMRDLLSRVALGTPGRWKVYIIDEVHQLTPDAASALLKTLEEPPSHVVFVLATTDPQKVLPTIQSRTQHFEFHLLDGDMLTDLLEGINADAGLGVPAEVVRIAVERGRGSARDAESALEQLAAAGDSAPDNAPLEELVAALAAREVGLVLQAVAKSIAAGKEPRRLGNDLVEYLRNAFLANQAPSLVLVPTAGRATLNDLAQSMGLAFLVRSMETVGRALVDMRDSVDPRVTLEVALVQLSAPVADASPASMLERLERLERQTLKPSPEVPLARAPVASLPPPSSQTAPAAEGNVAGPAVPGAGPAQARAALGAFRRAAPPGQSTVAGGSVTAAAPVRPAASHVPPATTAPLSAVALPSRDDLTKAWGDSVLGKLARPAQVYLGGGRFIESSGATAIFALPDRGLLERSAHFLPEVEKALAAHFGQPVPLRLVLDPGATAARPPGGPAPAEEEDFDLDEVRELADAPAAPAVPVEQRILEAFPGSVLDS
ncbi:MAG TPA: DNA polymerase III subunit gamma/tau [Acidimicrobiales bacterium]|nr:DNA polymerase III subunit gamma/tau [Acidimicrobiales bacterium]